MRLNKFIGYSIDDSSAVVCPNTATCRFLAPGKKRAVALVDERSCDPRSLFDSGRQVAKTSVYLCRGCFASDVFLWYLSNEK